MDKYNWHIRVHPTPSNCVSPLLFTEDGVPAYYPCCLLLGRIAAGAADGTVRALASDLIHIGRWLHLSSIDAHARFGQDDYLTLREVSSLAEWLDVRAPGPGEEAVSRSKVAKATRRRRFSATLAYFGLVTRHLGSTQIEWPPEAMKMKMSIEDKYDRIKRVPSPCGRYMRAVREG